jgi:hemin uptake protein HemP
MQAEVDAQSHNRKPAEEEAQTESAVLQYVLSHHPTPIGFADLRREFAPASSDFSHSDALERAVRELTSAGLLQRNGELVLPTRAALRLDQLLNG